MELNGSQGWGVVGSSNGWGEPGPAPAPVPAAQRQGSHGGGRGGRSAGRLTTAMLQESRPGGEGGHSEGVASSSKSSSKPTPATLHSRLDLDTTLLPLPARAPALPKAAALAEQLALVAKAAHSYDQLLEITQGWSLSLKAVDAAWTEAQRSREKGKGRAKDASLDALGGGTEYLGSAMSNPAIWDGLPLLARFIVGLPTALAQLRACPLLSDDFAKRIVLTLATRAASSKRPHEPHAPLAVAEYSAYLSSLDIPPWPICPIKVLLYFVSRLPERCDARIHLAVLTPQTSHQPFRTWSGMKEVRGRLAAAQKLTEDLWDALEPPVITKEPSVLNEIVEAARKACSPNAGMRRASDQAREDKELDGDNEPWPPKASLPSASSLSPSTGFKLLLQSRTSSFSPLPTLLPQAHHTSETDPSPAPPFVRYVELSEGEAELEAARVETRRQLALPKVQKRSANFAFDVDLSMRKELFLELNPDDWSDMFEEEEAPRSIYSPQPTLALPVLHPSASHSSPHTLQPPVSAPVLPSRQQPTLPATISSDVRMQSGEGGTKSRRKRRKFVVKSFQVFYDNFMRRK